MVINAQETPASVDIDQRIKTPYFNKEDIKPRITEIVEETGNNAKDALQNTITSGLKETELLSDNEIRNVETEITKINNEDGLVEQVTSIVSNALSAPHIQRGYEEKLRREFVENGNFIPLNEILSYHATEGSDDVYLHLAPARTIENAERRKLLAGGLRRLALELESNPDFKDKKRVGAISWIIGHPRIMKAFGFDGFEIEGEIPEKLKRVIFPDENKPVLAAYMDRDKFIQKHIAK